jgi:tetratricopeptide (TPR) repeat protein
MSDLQLPDRLVQLRSRWEADPASRIFLQLAEEYRHLGRVHDALTVLETGLKEHPGYLAALVAKGRCLLELGQAEPAREVLERVVRQDATQAVANKLLVRAYLETGQAERAKERLDLYGLLHDGDPEIEELRGRIRRLEGTPRASSPEPADARASVTPLAAIPSRAPATAGDVFQLDRRQVRHSEVYDVFELDYPAVAVIPLTTTAVAEPEPQAEIAAAAAAVAEPEPPPPPPPMALDTEPEPTPEGEPFPGLVSRAVRQRYLLGLAAEGLFPSAHSLAPAPTPAPPAELPVAVVEAPPEEATAPVELFQLRSIGEAVEAELRRSTEEPPPALPEPQPAEDLFVLEPAPAAEEAEPPAEPEGATATLGDLYLRQGHLTEAEDIYREVLRREPDNPLARAGLSRIAASRAEPEPAPAPAPPASPAIFAAPPAPASVDGRSRKILLLNSYLQRIRRGSHPDVP